MDKKYIAVQERSGPYNRGRGPYTCIQTVPDRRNVDRTIFRLVL